MVGDLKWRSRFECLAYFNTYSLGISNTIVKAGNRRVIIARTRQYRLCMKLSTTTNIKVFTQYPYTQLVVNSFAWFILWRYFLSRIPSWLGMFVPPGPPPPPLLLKNFKTERRILRPGKTIEFYKKKSSKNAENAACSVCTFTHYTKSRFLCRHCIQRTWNSFKTNFQKTRKLGRFRKIETLCN